MILQLNFTDLILDSSAELLHLFQNILSMRFKRTFHIRTVMKYTKKL